MKYILLILLFASCLKNPSATGSGPKSFGDFKVKVIDGCEYLEYNYVAGSTSGIYTITHKGNCSNKIHIYNHEH